MNSTAEAGVTFESFSLRFRQRTLYERARKIDLRPKSLEVLMFLVRQAGELVTKDALMAAVWPNLIVTDESVTRCVSDIRLALRDNDQHIIKTVPRRGYVFVAAVQPVEDLAPAAQQDDPLADPVAEKQSLFAAMTENGSRSITMRYGLGIAAGLLALGILAGWDGDANEHHPAVRPPARVTATSDHLLSIVVLPFALLNADPDQAYFAEGLTADLTTDLSRIPDSFVIARGTADSYRGKVVDERAIGHELRVRYVLEGSVQRLADQVRVNVRLIEAETGNTVWADRLDGNGGDLASLQRNIVGSVARTLHLALGEAESQRAQHKGMVHPDARDLTWQAWSLYERRTPETVAAARELLTRAVDLDPKSAFAWSLLSDTYTTDLLNRWLQVRGSTRAAWLNLAQSAADRAYALDSANLYAVGARATVLQLRGQPEQGLALLERQVSLNRNYAPAWHRISYAYATLGQPDRAIQAGLEAVRLSPRDGRLYSIYIVIAAAELQAGHDAAAVEWARKSIEQRPEFGIAYAWLAAANANLGDIAAAHNAIAKFRELQPDYTIGSFRAEQQSTNEEFLKQRERFYAGLTRAGLNE